MKREENIFFNIVKNETSLTEVFCNLLNYKVFRELFLKIIKEKNITFDTTSNINYNCFKTEVTLDGDKGRVDLYLNVNNIEYLFEIKVERYTQLTDNQPEGYLQYLNDKNIENSNKNLFFILPRGYLHLSDIHKRWNKKSGYSKANIDNQNIIYWDEILNEIKKQELDKSNLFIDEFYKILNYRWFSYKDIKFSKSEIRLMKLNTINKGYKMLSDLNIPTLMNKLFEIVDSVYEKFHISKKDDEQSADAYGYTLNNSKHNIRENWTVWFGVDFEIWANGKSPITIQIYSDNNGDMPEIQKLVGSEKFEYKNETEDEETIVTTYIELDKTLFENNNENIAENLRKKIDEIINKIQI